MKLLPFKDKSGETLFWYKKNYTDDIIDLWRFNRKRPCDKWRDIFGGTERQAVTKVKKLFLDFMEEVASDLIENNNAFVFPYKEGGHIKVGDVTSYLAKASYRIETSGIIYGGIIKYKKTSYNNKEYRLKFTRKHGHRIFQRASNGKTYF